MTTHVYKSASGVDIAIDVYGENKGERNPAVVFVHGGGLILGSRRALLPAHIQAFTDAGFVFTSIDYRLAPEARLPEIVSDLNDAWAWLVSHASQLGINRERVVLFGHSAGGFLALLGGCQLSPRPAAVISVAGYGRLRTEAFMNPSRHYLDHFNAADEATALSAVGTTVMSEGGPGDSIQWFTGRGNYYLYCRQRGLWLSAITDHDPNDHGWYARYEPILKMTHEYPPTLLLHGEPDTDVGFEESVQVQRTLRAAGVECELLSDPGWGHAFIYMTDEPTVQTALSRIVGFASRHAGIMPRKG